jgi:hypothetical protein
MAAMGPLMNRLETGRFVPSKDGHPGNFLVYGGKVAPLDTEKGYLTSQMIEIANLVDYTGKYDFNQRVEFLKGYSESYNGQLNREAMNINDQAVFEYLSSVIYRSLSYYGFFSSINAESDYKLQWLKNGFGAIKDVKENFSEFYNKDRLDFVKIDGILHRLLEHELKVA